MINLVDTIIMDLENMSFQELMIRLKEAKEIHPLISIDKDGRERVHRRIIFYDAQIKKLLRMVGKENNCMDGNYKGESLVWFDRLPKIGFFTLGMAIASIISIIWYNV